MQRISALLSLALLALIPVAPAAAADGPRCTDPAFGWSDTTPSVNVRHIFCGQYNAKGKPVGAHSLLIMHSSADVTTVGEPSASHNGLTVRPVTFSNGETKTLKSFFPEACGLDRILRSVLHAASVDREVGTWRQGPSAPEGGGAAYCLDDAGQPFTVQFAWIGEGKARINTAFPIVPTR